MEDWLIYAYGSSYNSLVYAIKTVSAIITSWEFQALMTAVVVLAVAVCIIYTAVMSAYGGKITHTWVINLLMGVIFMIAVIKPEVITHTWVINLLMGVIFMIAVIKPEVNVIIEDKDNGSATFGYFTTLDNVPFAVAFPAWFLSTSEDSIKKLVNKFASPIVNTLDYTEIGGELSYKLLLNMNGLTSSARKVSPELYKYTMEYMRYCVNVGLTGGWIKLDKLENPDNKTLWETIKIEKKVPLFGFPKDKEDCSELYTYLNEEFAGPTGQKIITHYCMSNGYESAVGGQCSKVMKNLFKNHFNKGDSDALNKFLAGYIAVDAGKSIALSYMNQAEKQVDVSNAMAAFQADKWLPKLRSSTTVAVILLAPLCFLLIFFAPGGVIRWYGGMYVWLILWSGIDQIFYMKYQNDIYEAYTAMRNSGLGINDMLNIHYPLLEPLGMYGKMRWISMTLGLAMCMGILKIGNHAMVSIAEGMGQVMQQTASQAAGQLAGAGGTNAAADQYIREKARGWAAGMASPRQIENQAVFEYETGLQNAWQNTAFGNTAERLARRSAIDNAINLRSVEAMVNRYGADEYINQMASNKIFGEERTLAEYKQMTELFGDSRLAAITMGTMAANNQYVSAGEMEGMINAMGGVQNLADAKGELSAAGLMENVSRYNTLKELFGGNAEEAYKAMGQMSAESSLISYQDLQTMKGLYGGDVKELADAKAFMSAFNFMQQQGGIDSVKDKMGALGFTSVRQFSEFASNNFALNEEMANRLDAKYNTTAFEEGHRITFDVNSSGGVSNMVAHSTGNVVLVGNKLVQGATEEIRFNESGVLNRTYTGGSIDGKTGTMVLDGNDNAIWTDLKSGSNLALGKATVINQDTLLAIAKGDIKAINSINLFGLDSEARDSVLNQVSHQVERYVQQNSGSGTSAHFTSTTYAEGSMGLDIAGNKAVMGTKVEAGASTSGTSSTMYNQIATGLQRKEDEITTLMKGGLTEKQANEVMARYLGNIYGDAMRMQDTGALRNLFHDNPNYDIFSSTPDKPKGFIM